MPQYYETQFYLRWHNGILEDRIMIRQLEIIG